MASSPPRPVRPSPATTWSCLTVVYGLDVVAVGIAQEHSVITRVVLGPFARPVQYFRPGRDGGVVHRIHGLAVGRAERHVQFPGLGSGGRPQPELGHAVRAGQADDDGVTVREAHRLAHPDRGEGAQVEVQGGVDILHLKTDVIKHGRSLATSYDIPAVTDRVAHYPGGRIEIAQFAIPARARRDPAGRVPGPVRGADADRRARYRSVHRSGGHGAHPAARRGPLPGLAPGR